MVRLLLQNKHVPLAKCIHDDREFVALLTYYMDDIKQIPRSVQSVYECVLYPLHNSDYFTVQQWSVFIINLHVYCAVWNESFNINEGKFCSFSSSCRKGLGTRPAYHVRGGHVAGQVAYLSEHFRPTPTPLISLPRPIFIYTLLTYNAWDPYKKQCSFGTWGTVDREGILVFL